MSSHLLTPNASAPSLPYASTPSAARGLRLGDHVDENDVALKMQSGVSATNPLTDGMGRHFHPYEDNGGTVLAVAGKDYAIVASDTRLGSGYSIPSRYVSRIIKLTDRVVLASSGMQTDIAVLHKVLKIRLTQYRHNHHREMSLTAVSQMLSNILYYRRFQPYYTFNVLGGLDDEGQGWSYGYDAIGSHEKIKSVVSGTGQNLLQPVMDNQVEFKQMAEGAKKEELTLEQCVDLVKDGFTSACERDIYTGDQVEVCKITEKGVEIEVLELRRD